MHLGGVGGMGDTQGSWHLVLVSNVLGVGVGRVGGVGGRRHILRLVLDATGMQAH